MNIQNLLGITLPVILAPMVGVQTSALAIAVSSAGGLGSLPYKVNFFCHTPPAPDTTREAMWRATLAPYYVEFDIDRVNSCGDHHTDQNQQTQVAA